MHQFSQINRKHTDPLMQVVIIIIVIAAGSSKVDVSNWSPVLPNGFGAVLTGTTIVFFAYVGFDAVANTAEETKNPQVCCSGIKDDAL